MGNVEIRRLNEDGLALFSRVNWGNKAGSDGDPPPNLLFDDDYTEIVTFSDGNTRKIDEDTSFTTGKQMVDLLDASFGNKVEFDDISEDAGMWAWLALLFYNDLRFKNPDGTWKNAKVVRFIFGEARAWYRHSVAARYAVWKTYGEGGMVYLHGPSEIWSEVSEQILSVALINSSETLIKATNALYYDSSRVEGFKVGAGGKGAGSPRRFRTVFWQLYETFDLRMMTPANILARLPDEFEKYQPVQEGDDEE